MKQLDGKENEVGGLTVKTRAPDLVQVSPVSEHFSLFPLFTLNTLELYLSEALSGSLSHIIKTSPAAASHVSL